MPEFRHYQLTALEGRANDLRQSLAELALIIEAIEGCEKVMALQDPSEPEIFMMFERWTSRECRSRGEARLSEALAAAVTDRAVKIEEASWLALPSAADMINGAGLLA